MTILETHADDDARIRPDAEVEPTAGESGVPRFTGLWRALSLLLVALASLTSIVWILQSRGASDVAARNTRTLDLDTVRIAIGDLPTVDGAALAVLGSDWTDRVELVNGVADIEAPSTVHSVIGLFDDDDVLLGLRLLAPGARSDAEVLDADTTARALLALSPALLMPDIEATLDQFDGITGDPAYDELVAAIRRSPILSFGNPVVEDAIAAILDRVPDRRPLPEQGCDSILNPRAFPATGTCVQPSASRTTITNEQDRWVVVFAGPEPWGSVCALLAPARQPGAEITIRDECGDQALFAAPGPIIDPGADANPVNQRIRWATGVHLFDSYAAPFVDLVGGAAGYTAGDTSPVLRARDPLVDTVASLEGQAEFSSALDALISPASPVERHAATIAASRDLILEAGAAAVIPEWNPDASGHGILLNLYDRVGERMAVVDRTSFRWQADAAVAVPLGGGS